MATKRVPKKKAPKQEEDVVLAVIKVSNNEKLVIETADDMDPIDFAILIQKLNVSFLESLRGE